MKNTILRQSLLFFFCWRLRRHFVALCATQLLTSDFLLQAQAPQGIPYQAIARNASGAAIASTAVRVRFSIRDSIATGTIRYQETHNPTTSALGLFSVNVGRGTVVSGSFAGINWGKNAKFLQVELDPAGGTSYTDLGTTQMMSVPYALNAGSWTPTGAAYGAMALFNCDGQISFSPCLPKVSTTAASSISALSANSGGDISADGGASITARGVCWSTSQNPTTSLTTKTSDGTGSGSFGSSISGLAPNTLYYVRAYATNSAGTVYGNQISFTTAAIVLPTLSTTAASTITTTTANSGGNITSDGGGTITARGVCWSTSQNPTISLTTKTSNGTGSGSFTSSLTGLSPNTLYYVRAYATNSAGTAYGNQISFTTPVSTSPVDVDGNTYTTVTIGSQVWMKENLKVSKYRNGNPIPTNLNDASWSSTTSGAYAIYNNAAANNTTYGKLYNWYAIADVRGLCPTGWHVPTDHDWQILTKNLDPTADTTQCCSNISGGKMKSIGTIQTGTGLWQDPNTEASNSSGFSALPSGFRDFDGPYFYMGENSLWLSSTEIFGAAGLRFLSYSSTNSYQGFYNKTAGFSVRCLRD